ncbi:hypothetical protein Fmac_026864 [Flemingia macrophylla]|uniref:Uncharacterized protein n=1 Tax=Flemingia macrophylla TaxID=520843 RepID=A0ABD1LG24_9FABA
MPILQLPISTIPPKLGVKSPASSNLETPRAQNWRVKPSASNNVETECFAYFSRKTYYSKETFSYLFKCGYMSNFGYFGGT